MVIFRTRRKVMIVERIAGVWTIIARKWLWSNNIVKFRGNAWRILPETPAYVGRRYIIYYLTTKGEQLTFDQIDLKQQGQLTEDIFCKEIVRQLASSLNTNPVSWMMLLYIAIGLLAGIPLGALIAPLIPGGA